MKEIVVCAICGSKMKSIGWKHLVSHDLTTNEYKHLYPKFALRSEASIARKKAGATRGNAHRIGKPRSQKVKDKISKTKSTANIPAWNKGISKSECERNHLSEVKKRLYQNGDITHWNIGNVTPDKVKRKISNTALSQNRYYSNNSKMKRKKTLLLKMQQGWKHHSSLNKGTPSNISDEARLRLSKKAINQNIQSKLKSETRIHDHIGRFNLILENVDDCRYVYTIKCSKCDTRFNRTKSVLVPYRYTKYNGTYCPTCYPVETGKYSNTYFINNPELKQTPSVLYVVTMCSGSESFIKVGITRRMVKERLAGLPYTHSTNVEIPMTLFEAFTLEQRILQSDIHKYQPKKTFGGHTECFSLDMYERIVDSIVVHIPDQYVTNE